MPSLVGVANGWQTAELRRRFAQDGYVLIRGLLNRDSVEDARAAALEELAALRPELFAAGEPPHLGLTTPGATNLGLLGTPPPCWDRRMVWGDQATPA